MTRGLAADPGLFPLHLDIDPTSRCNLRCTMCPRTWYLERNITGWAPQGPGDMDFALYERLIREGSGKGLHSVKLNFLGEPLLYPRLADMVKTAAEAGLFVMLNTNAVLLTAEMSCSLLEAGLTDIFFSFDSPYPAEYEAVRVGAKYDQVLKNIAGFMAAKDEGPYKHVQTRASMVLPEDHPAPHRLQEDYIRLFRDLKVAEIGFGLPTVMDRNYAPLNPPSFVCPDLFRRMFVFRDGVCGPCCGDWDRKIPIGEVSGGQTLESVWQGEAYTLLRRKHRQGRYQEIEACRICSVPYLSSVEMDEE
jgi:hypothetical protein